MTKPPIKTGKRRPAQAAAATPPPTKLDLIVALLQRPEGATLAELVTATGWQAHSVRGALAAAVKKRLGAKVGVELQDGVRTYRAPQP